MLTASNWQDHLLVFDKPSGLPSGHIQNSLHQKCAIDFAAKLSPEILEVQGLKPEDHGLLHRLDTATSGLLLFAKTQEGFNYVRHLFEQKKIQKFYRALSEHQSDPRIIDWPIGNSAKTKAKVIVIETEQKLRQIRGKPYPAHTQILKCQELKPVGLFDFEICITTGVRHQIRAHMGAIESPILGDPRYKGAPSSRLWLHAWKVVLPVVGSGELILSSSLPGDWPPGF